MSLSKSKLFYSNSCLHFLKACCSITFLEVLYTLLDVLYTLLDVLYTLLDLLYTLLDLLYTLLEVSFMIFIAQASLMIVIYDRNMFIVQATGQNCSKLACSQLQPSPPILAGKARSLPLDWSLVSGPPCYQILV
jgi:hypothetical protein